MNARMRMIRSKINEMRARVAKAYEENKNYDEVLELSSKLDRLILLEIKAGKIRQEVG